MRQQRLRFILRLEFHRPTASQRVDLSYDFANLLWRIVLQIPPCPGQNGSVKYTPPPGS